MFHLLGFFQNHDDGIFRDIVEGVVIGQMLGGMATHCDVVLSVWELRERRERS